METAHPILADIVMVGGGHAQVAALKQFAMRPLAGARLTLITRDLRTPYSGMLPGYVEGKWSDDELHIDLAKLAQMANARLICSPVTGINPTEKTVTFADRPPLAFDILSLNIGGEPDLSAIPGAATHAIPVKPIAGFQHRLNNLMRDQRPNNLVVIGGGAAGCELALALSKRWLTETGKRPQMTLVSRSEELMPHMATKAGHLIRKTLEAADIKIISGQAVSKISADDVTLDDGNAIQCDACFLVSAVRPADWISKSGLALDQDGFVAVSPTLQTLEHPNIFAAGDIATLVDTPRPKAGVFAVRAGPILATNLRRYALNKRLKLWKPQNQYLAIIGTADGSALATRGDRANKSSIWWRLKCWIDERWMAKYTDLAMPTPDAPRPLAGIASPHFTDQSQDPVFDAMRCLGCAAKTGHETLALAMEQAIAAAITLGANPDHMPDPGLGEDSAIFPSLNGDMVQSVDVISQIVSDPFTFGKIAAIHALSDLYAANAQPRYALAILSLAQARADLQQNQLAQLLTGALLALSDADVKLIGGHTGESEATSAGFAVTGQRNGTPMPLDPSIDYSILLTKPIGTGTIMAAHMQLKARAGWVDGAIAAMTTSNGPAATCIAEIDPNCWMTDITGFGLARHIANLVQRAGAKGAVIWPDAVPLLSGTDATLAAGITSSLHGQNRAAVRIDRTEYASAHEFLYDPQTSGGLAVIMPSHQARSVNEELRVAGHDSAIIGAISHSQVGLRLAPAPRLNITDRN